MGKFVKKGPAPQESTGKFIGRNLSKAPALWYESARSGLGLGNILDMAIRQTEPAKQQYAEPTNQLDAIGQAVNKRFGDVFSNLRSGASRILPSTQKANEEISHILPKSMTEHKPEDWLMELLINELPMAAMSGGFSGGLKGLGKYSLGAGAMHAGGHFGGELGGAVGSELGNEEVGRLLGGLAGGVGAGMLTHKILPSQVLPGMQEESQRKSWEEQKKMSYEDFQAQLAKEHEDFLNKQEYDIKYLENMTEQERADFRNEQSSELKAIQEEHRQLVKELEDEHTSASQKLPQETEAFRKEKQARIKALQKRKSDYDKKIKEHKAVVKEFGEKHSNFTGQEVGDASGILDTIDKIRRELGEGITKADRDEIEEFIGQLQASIKGKYMSLKTAKKFLKRKNERVFPSKTPKEFNTVREVSNTLKEELNRLSEPLHQFISDTASPEHAEAFQKYNESTQAYKQMEMERPNFRRSVDEEIGHARADKFSETRKNALERQQKQAADKLATTKAQHKKEVSALEKRKPAGTHAKALEEARTRKIDDAVIQGKITELEKQTWEGHKKSQIRNASDTEKILKHLGKLTTSWGSSGAYAAYGIYKSLGLIPNAAGTALVKIGTKAAQEIALATKVLKENPELRQPYAKLLTMTAKEQLPDAIRIADRLGEDLQRKIEEQKKKKKGGRFVKRASK